MSFDQVPGADHYQELSPLADQLASDAARLDATYPAGPMPEALATAIAAARHSARHDRPARPARWRPMLVRLNSAAAMALAGAALCGAWAWQAGVFRAASPGGGGFDELPVNRVRHDQGGLPAALGVQPAGWFENYNSSEQERVLDLLERADDPHEEPISL